MADLIALAPVRFGWAIKHNGSILGYAGSHGEATLLGHGLLEWLTARGKSAELVVDAPSGEAAPATAEAARSESLQQLPAGERPRQR